MSDVIGRGVIEVSADSTKLKAGIDDAKKSLKGLGIAASDASKSQSRSIDAYIKQLGIAAATTGKTGRELELYKLALRGASDEQLKAADSALRLTEAYAKGEAIGNNLRTGMLAVGAAAATGLIAAYVAFDQLVKKAGDFQDMAEKTGDTAENIASLAVAAGTAGVEMDAVVSASAKLTKNLTGVDDESKAAGAAISALGLKLDDFKKLPAADQLETVGKALNGFEDGAGKTAVAMALLGKSGAELLPFLKELGQEGGRQAILTQKQIDMADEYADKQAKLRTQIGLHAQAIATQMLPSYNDLNAAFLDLIKDVGGVKDGVKGLGNTTGIQDFADSAVTSLAFIVDSADGVYRVFDILGKGIGGLAAAGAAAASGEGKQAARIIDELGADVDKILGRETLGQRLAARIAARKAGVAPPESDDPVKPKLNFNGADKPEKKGKDTAAQEAKAQLAFDLDQIKKASESVTGTFANAEKIMEARRAAGLIDEREYYAEKLRFLNQNSAEQERALQQEIERMQAENLVGKDKINNDRKIVDAQAKLAKVREDAVTNVKINSIQEEAAVRKVESAYLTATQAAQDYFDTLKKQQQREIASVGMGERKRSLNAGISQIEDQYSGQRTSLENQKAQLELEGKFTVDAEAQYKKRLAIIDEFQSKSISSYIDYYGRLMEQQGNWALGAQEALQNYADQSQNVFKGTEGLVTDAFRGMENALVDFAMTGKLSFTDLANSIVANITRIIIQQQISNALGVAGSAGGAGGGWLGSLAGMAISYFAGGNVSVDTSMAGSAPSNYPDFVRGGRALGGPVSAGELYQVNEKGPELLNVAGRQYLMMGSQGGSVEPSSGSSRTSPQSMVVNNHFTIQGPTDRRSEAQIAAKAGQALQRAMQRYT